LYHGKKHNGYSIIELLVVIVIVGIITSVALKSLRTVNDTSRTEKTKKELDQLAYAVAGDPNLTSGGTRADFGYVGDVGGMPANLDALVSNPGGYATWNGPYLRDDYLPASGSSNTEFKVDEWGTDYNYSGNTISSTGGGTTITRKLANSVNDLLYNPVNVTVTDINNIPPGATYKDSVKIVLTYPNGAGTTTSKTKYPSANGFAQIDSIPIGQHTLNVIYTPLNDTLTRKVIVNPGELTAIDVNLFRALWGTIPPTITGRLIIRPNAPGMYSEIISSGCAANWQCTDESMSDGDATYVESIFGPWSTDTYELENISVTGTIDSIAVFIRVRNTGTGQLAKTAIVVNGNLYNGGNINLNPYSTYTVFSTTYVTNPQTATAWTWADINNLQAGAGIKDPGRCTQVWVEIYYTP